MIDFHVHFGNIMRESYPLRTPLSVEQVLDRMNRSGIDLSVLLPLESPEGEWGYMLTEDAVAARNKYPERFISFVCVDPRYPCAEKFIDHFVLQHDCRGFGEHVNGLKFDDPLNKAIYRKCNEYHLPLVFGDDLGCFDEPGLPRLEACLQEFPNVKFCGHGPGFWSAISGDDDRSIVYPTTPVRPGGTLDRLLAKYDNLYGDLSAGSGHNAMSRDPEFTRGFVDRHWRKLLWGSDYDLPHQPIPQLKWIRGLGLAPEKFQAMTDGNARRLLNLNEPGAWPWPNRTYCGGKAPA
jgi:predicted TIM-barrel fold metal-dependent hydrolase